MIIDTLIGNLNYPILTTISTLINNEIFFTLLIVIIILITERRNEKRKKIFSAILVALLLSFVIKEIYHIPRPCFSGISKIPCPTDTYSFPSIHAAVVFTLMLSYINKGTYWAYLFFALFVSFSRIYLGVHSFEDIAGAIVVAAISYYIIDMVIKNEVR